MKASTLALFLGSATAVKLNDAPDFFNEPTWRQTWPSASGLVQLETSLSACQRFGGAGVTCGPADEQLFATGMEDSEVLAFNAAATQKTCQCGSVGCDVCSAKNMAQADPAPAKPAAAATLPPCHGNNGPDGVNCAREICNGTNGPKDGHTGTPCTREEPATGDLPPTTTGTLTPTRPGGNLPDAPPAKAALQLSAFQAPFPQYESEQPEKVLTPQTTWANYHTTYY